MNRLRNLSVGKGVYPQDILPQFHPPDLMVEGGNQLLKIDH